MVQDVIETLEGVQIFEALWARPTDYKSRLLLSFWAHLNLTWEPFQQMMIGDSAATSEQSCQRHGPGTQTVRSVCWVLCLSSAFY